VLIAAIIGDVVGSRQAPDRDALQRSLLDVLAAANADTNPQTELTLTRGDEFEGAYASIGTAWEASLMLHLLMRSRGHSLWISVAWGEVTALPNATDAAVQDGPAWWAARSALTELKQATRAPKNRRTVFSVDDQTSAGLFTAAATLRDEVLAGLDESDAAITLGLLNGTTQRNIAAQLGVTAGVISRRIHRNGLLSLAESAKITT